MAMLARTSTSAKCATESTAGPLEKTLGTVTVKFCMGPPRCVALLSWGVYGPEKSKFPMFSVVSQGGEQERRPIATATSCEPVMLSWWQGERGVSSRKKPRLAYRSLDIDDEGLARRQDGPGRRRVNLYILCGD